MPDGHQIILETRKHPINCQWFYMKVETPDGEKADAPDHRAALFMLDRHDQPMQKLGEVWRKREGRWAWKTNFAQGHQDTQRGAQEALEDAMRKDLERTAEEMTPGGLVRPGGNGSSRIVRP